MAPGRCLDRLQDLSISLHAPRVMPLRPYWLHKLGVIAALLMSCHWHLAASIWRRALMPGVLVLPGPQPCRARRWLKTCL